MSKAHFAHKNIDWPNMLNILCYNTEKPFLLSKKQQVTRLYKTCNRTAFDGTYRELVIAEPVEHFREDLNRRRKEFAQLLTLDRNSKQFVETIKKYEEFVSDRYDINALLYDNQPYSLNSLKLTVYTDEVCLSAINV